MTTEELKRIKEIINRGDIPISVKSALVFQVVTASEDAISTMLKFLKIEKSRKDTLIKDLSFLLSQTHSIMENPGLDEDHYMKDTITKFYREGRVYHYFQTFFKRGFFKKK